MDKVCYIKTSDDGKYMLKRFFDTVSIIENNNGNLDLITDKLLFKNLDLAFEIFEFVCQNGKEELYKSEYKNYFNDAIKINHKNVHTLPQELISLIERYQEIVDLLDEVDWVVVDAKIEFCYKYQHYELYNVFDCSDAIYEVMHEDIVEDLNELGCIEISTEGYVE